MKFYLLALIFLSIPCFAEYTANHSSKVSWVKIYNNDTIYFGLESMPADHKCQHDYFVLSPNLTEKQRERYYSLILTARVNGQLVSVGYDKDNPHCVGGRPVVYAISH